MIDREFAGFAVIGVAENTGVTGRPGIDDRNPDAPQKKPQFSHREGGIISVCSG